MGELFPLLGQGGRAAGATDIPRKVRILGQDDSGYSTRRRKPPHPLQVLPTRSPHQVQRQVLLEDERGETPEVDGAVSDGLACHHAGLGSASGKSTGSSASHVRQKPAPTRPASTPPAAVSGSSSGYFTGRDANPHYHWANGVLLGRQHRRSKASVSTRRRLIAHAFPYPHWTVARMICRPEAPGTGSPPVGIPVWASRNHFGNPTKRNGNRSSVLN